MQKEYITVNIDELKPYENNPRHNDQAVDAVAESIDQCGYIAPIIVDEDNEILAGHTRLKALKRTRGGAVEVIRVSGLTDEQKRKYRLLDNKTNELASWDFEKLEFELADLDFGDFDFGFEEKRKFVTDKPEVEFTEVLGEEHNYIVLYFDNDIDWLQIASLLDIKEKKNLSTRKDGTITKSMERKGIGRVFKGSDVLEMLRGYYENIG